jgi:hypothetical protein
MQDDTPTVERLQALRAELRRQDSELARTRQTLAELADVTLRVREADLLAIAEAIAPGPPSPTPCPWNGARC